MQIQLPMPTNLPEDAYAYGERTSGETHGVVLTKPHVVDLILDLAGYTADRDLGAMTLLEPSCGTGAFLLRALERLVASARAHGRPLARLGGCLVGFDIDATHVAQTRLALCGTLLARGEGDMDVAMGLATRWVREGDFLLAPLPQFDFVIGNPPYIRIEQLAPQLQAEYRRRYTSLFDRADLYVAFIERGLQLLREGGVLSFICADRWILNKYGAPLRELVTSRYAVKCYVDLHDASPFESDVIAYPSIFVLSTGKTGRVPVARLVTASEAECKAAGLALRSLEARADADVVVYESWFDGADPWVLGSPAHLRVLRELESRLPTLEGDGVTRVRIGVASGADEAYIVPSDADIEPDRLVPLVMREDITAGQVRDAARCVINTFGANGKLIDLVQYPRLARHLIAQRHMRQEVQARAVADEALGAPQRRDADAAEQALVPRAIDVHAVEDAEREAVHAGAAVLACDVDRGAAHAAGDAAPQRPLVLQVEVEVGVALAVDAQRRCGAGDDDVGARTRALGGRGARQREAEGRQDQRCSESAKADFVNRSPGLQPRASRLHRLSRSHSPASISTSESSTTSAIANFLRSCWISPGTAMHAMRAALAAITPNSESSMARHAVGATPRRCAVVR